MMRFSPAGPFPRTACTFLFRVLVFTPTLLWAQGGSAPTTTTVSDTGSGPYSFNASVTGHALAAPTGSVMFTDQTATRSLGTASLGAAVTTQSFGSQNVHSGFSLPYSLAAGDFNGDNKLDLAVTNFGANAVSVLLGKGDGTFPLQPANYPVGVSPRSVTVGDVNSDGKLDLVVANSDSNTVSVLLGKGDGTFLPQASYSVGLGPSFVAVGDFNGDGHLDLAVANTSGNNVNVLLGKGDGTFVLQTTSYGSNDPRSIEIDDIIRDGNLDLDEANDDGTINVLLGNGSGLFSFSASYQAGNEPFFIVASDLNGDGHADLVPANYSGNNVSVLLGKGDGTFPSQPTTYAVGYNPTALAVSDFNGDGHPDLAVVNYDDTLSVLLNQGEGTFPSQPTSYPVGAEPQWIAAGDFNGDGIPDLVVANLDSNTVGVLLNNLTHTASATLSNTAITGTGAHTVQAAYGGDSIYGGSSGTASVAASAVSTTLSLGVPSSAVAGQSVQISASLSPAVQDGLTTTGSVSFTDTSTNRNLGTAPVNNGIAVLAASFPKVGAQVIQAHYAGDGNFAPAISNLQTIQVMPASTFTITAYPSSEFAVKRGVLGGFLLELQPVNGFGGSVKLTCSGGPAGSYCADLPQTVNLNGKAFVLSGLFFPPQSATGTYTITFTGVSGPITSNATAKFIVK